jgi:hypothetical protein
MAHSLAASADAPVTTKRTFSCTTYRAEIPAPVFQHIFIHEIIHLLVPPREIKGKLKAHLPEFWELEKRLSPQSADAWDWIEFNFSKVLREDRRNESDRVRRNWKNAAPVALLGWEDVLGIDDSARIEFVRKTVSFNVTYAAARQAAKDAFAKTRAVAEVNPTPLLPQGAPAGERTGIAPSCRTVE